MPARAASETPACRRPSLGLRATSTLAKPAGTVPTIPAPERYEGRRRPAAASPRAAAAAACRRCRRCRSRGRCRRRRGTATASARSRAAPRARARGGRRASSDLVEVARRRCCWTPFTNTSNGPSTCVGQLDLTPLIPRSIRCHSACAVPPCHTSSRASSRSRRPAVATRATADSCPASRIRRTRTASTTRSSSSRSSPASIFVARRGRADRSSSSSTGAGKRARTAEGPQIHGSTRLEIIWTVVPVVFLAAIGDASSSTSCRGSPTRRRPRPPTRRGSTCRGRAVLLAVPLPERRDLDRPHGRAGRPGRERGHHRARLTTSSTRWWVPGLRRQVSTRSRARSNKTWFEAPAGTLRRALLRALRDPARGDDARPSRSCRARSTTRSSRKRAVDRRDARRSASEEWEGVCQNCHRLDHKLHRPGARRQPAARRPQGHRDAAAERPGTDAGGRPRLDATQQIDALVAYTKQFAKAGGVDGGQRRDGRAVPRRLAQRAGHARG